MNKETKERDRRVAEEAKKQEREQQWALLFLENLHVVKFTTRDELDNAYKDAHIKNRPCVVLLRRERAGQLLWSIGEAKIW